MDEQPIQLVNDAYASEKMKPGKVRREDYEYKRKGSCSLFMFTEPLVGWRYAQVNTLHEAFKPEIAWALTQRLEIHYMPKHGSWLNMAEIELRALTIQCLDRRIGSMEQLQREVTAWEVKRNQSQKSIQWHFTTE